MEAGWHGPVGIDVDEDLVAITGAPNRFVAGGDGVVAGAGEPAEGVAPGDPVEGGGGGEGLAGLAPIEPLGVAGVEFGVAGGFDRGLDDGTLVGG